jgi:hypothetical protein
MEANMANSRKSRHRHLWLVGLIGSLLFSIGAAQAQEQVSEAQGTQSPFTVDGQVALNALMALGDAHLQKMADVLTILAGTDAVRSGEWESIREPLAEAERVTVPAVLWFALPDGTYWTLEKGLVDANLADRPYFPRVLAGETVLGDLVVSRSTGKSTAIVAVPVHDDANAVVGVLGSSVHLDGLSRQIKEEMGVQPDQIFYSIDATPVVGLHVDPETIFLHPLEEGEPEVQSAIEEMLSREKGVVSYSFRGEPRKVIYRKSPVTNWWYAFGVVRESE